jgi:light-regulated signal transduction histidine kinase (bacteriophytochrome)
LVRILLENLIGNAWKFTAHQATPRIEIGTLQQDDARVIFVRDNGTGFDASNAPGLFGAFQRFHAAGTFDGAGVGLAIAQRVVNRHGGRIWAESKRGHGATFFFTL